MLMTVHHVKEENKKKENLVKCVYINGWSDFVLLECGQTYTVGKTKS